MLLECQKSRSFLDHRLNDVLIKIAVVILKIIKGMFDLFLDNLQKMELVNTNVLMYNKDKRPVLLLVTISHQLSRRFLRPAFI